MRAILILLLIVSLWVTACAGVNYARSTASAVSIVSAVSQCRTPEQAGEIEQLEALVVVKLNGIRRPYVSLARTGGAAAVLSILGLVVDRRRRMADPQVRIPSTAGGPQERRSEGLDGGST